MKIAGTLDHLEQSVKDSPVEKFAALPTFTSDDEGKIVHVTTGGDRGYHGGIGAPVNAFVKLDASGSVFTRTVGGTGADFAFDDLDGALAAFEASSAKECILQIGAAGVIADGSPVTITKGPVTFKGTVEGASVTISGPNAVTFNLPDTDQTPVTFENCDISKTPGDDEWIFLQSGVLRLINSTINNISGADSGLFRQVAVGGTLKVFARNCTFTAAQDTGTDSPIFLSLATSGTGLELHLDDCTYVRDAANPTSLLKCTAANVRFVLENHTVLFGPRIKTSTFSIKYDGTSLMADDKNNTGTATVHGEAAYSTKMDALAGVDIEIFESFGADARKFVGDVLHILPGTYTYPATSFSNWQNLAGKTIYGDGKSSKIIFPNAFSGNRISITGSGNDNLVIRGMNFELQAALSGGQVLFAISTSDKIRFENCTFGNTVSNAGKFCFAFLSSTDECVIRDCEFAWDTEMDGIDFNDTSRSSIYNCTFIGQISIGVKLQGNAQSNYVFGNHFERTGGGSGTTSIQLLGNTDFNVVVNNYVGIASTGSGGINIDPTADNNTVMGNYGQDDEGDFHNIRFTDSGVNQTNQNFIFDPASMGRIATVMCGVDEHHGSLGQALQRLDRLHSQTYGVIFAFIRGNTNIGSFGSTTRRDLVIIGVSDDAQITFASSDIDLNFVGGSAAKRLVQIIDCDILRSGTNGGSFDSAVSLDVRLKNCTITSSGTNTTSIFETAGEMNVECEDCTFANTNVNSAIFENESVSIGTYAFKNCTAATQTGDLILNSNGAPPASTIRILERTDFGDVPVDLVTGTVTIHHDGTGRWDETSLTSGTITRTGHQFSTDEVATGTSWIDGSEIFRKVVNTGALLNATPTTTAHNITGLDKNLFIRAFAEEPGGNQITLPHNDVAAVSGGDVGIHVNDTNIVIDTVGDASAFTVSHAELWFTKV